ncbi:MAG: hypothetical protein HQK60_10590 [Deltaproteobacteria bacterium]|nr:hypothetical protein [Deltaproteobacteria bacterium]
MGDVQLDHLKKNKIKHRHHQQGIQNHPQKTQKSDPVSDLDLLEGEYPDESAIFE